MENMKNYENVNYNNEPNGMNDNNYRQASYLDSFPIKRSYIKFLTGFSIFFGLIIHLILLYYVWDLTIVNKIGDLSMIGINNINDFYSNYIPILIIIISFSLVKTFIFSYKIWNLISHTSDEELIKNKWCILLLSLSSGGTLIPMIMLRFFPNTKLVGKTSSKLFIGKNFSLSWLVGSILSIITLLTITIVNNGLNTHYSSGAINSILLTISLLLITFAFSLIGVNLFYKKTIMNDLEQKNTIGKIANVFSYILLTIISIQLFLRIIVMLLHVLEGIGNAFASRNIINIIINILFELVRIVIFICIAQIIIGLLKSLWSAQRNTNGIIVINPIESRAYEQYKSRINSSRRRRFF